MRLRELDRYLGDRGLVLWVGPPYYRGALAFAEEPASLLVEAFGESLEELAAELIAEADVLQRQRDERWAVRPNPVLSLTSIDHWLTGYGLWLNLRPRANGTVDYAAWVEDGDGRVTAPIAGPSAGAVLRQLVVETPRLVEPLEEYREVVEPSLPGPSPERIAAAIEEAGSVSGAARRLGVPRSTLRSWMERGGVEVAEEESSSREEIRAALEEGGTIQAAADMLGIARSTLRHRMKRLGIAPPPRRPRAGLPRSVEARRLPW